MSNHGRRDTTTCWRKSHSLGPQAIAITQGHFCSIIEPFIVSQHAEKEDQQARVQPSHLLVPILTYDISAASGRNHFSRIEEAG